MARKLAKIIREENPVETENNWISPAEALKMLNVTNKVTLQRLRDAGKIRFSQPQKKIILYDKQSIIDYLNNNSKNSFRKI